MSNRLAYSEAGFERAILVTSSDIVAIVEGKSDIYFYEQLMDRYIQYKGLRYRYQVRTPKEVKGKADGKKSLIEIFKVFRHKNKLNILTGSHKKKHVIFFADKDYDNYSRSCLRSKNLIYTNGVTMENTAYLLGELHTGLESTIGRKIDQRKLPFLTDFASWKVDITKQWREWVIYCMMCEISKVAPRKNRGGPSKIHVGQPPSLDNNKYLNKKQEFIRAIGDNNLAQYYIDRSERSVDRAISSGDVDNVFCGKWFMYFIEYEVRNLGGVYASISVNSKTLISHLLGSMDFIRKHGRYYFNRLDSIIE